MTYKPIQVGQSSQNKFPIQTIGKIPRKGNAMKFKLSTSGLAGNIRQLLAILGIAESATNAVHLPGNIRSVMLASSTLLLTVEHYLDSTQSAAPVVPAATVAGTVANGSSSTAGQA